MPSAMASLLRATPGSAALLSLPNHNHASVATAKTLYRMNHRVRIKVVTALQNGDSYLDMWKNAVDLDKKEIEFQKLADNLSSAERDSDKDVGDGNAGGDIDKEVLEKKSEEFHKMLGISREERDRVQGMQVIDRAAAAIAAARSLLKNTVSPVAEDSKEETGGTSEIQPRGSGTISVFVTKPETSGNGAPGPDFWSWTPPKTGDEDVPPGDVDGLPTARQSPVFPTSTNPVFEKDRPTEHLSIPFESKSKDTTLPPFQSMIEINTVDEPELKEAPSLEEHDLEVEFSAHAAEAAKALGKTEEVLPHGVNPDGSRWWKETGIEQRPDGVLCRWTMIRGVSADKTIEWQEKYWEASDEFDHKELGSEKSGRDANGNVWREYWRESMVQRCGIVQLEKTADKWGRNGKDEEWQEQWWEHYDTTGQSEKWAHKWCSIDPNTPLEAGHAHFWHERWGEKYDGHGGSTKYTDKWAERCEGDGWSKWGDKWDEHFDTNGHGVKQGETWWQGKHGESWNRTWGECHNGSGWIHKYGKSSSGEHWDTYAEQETWYERFPHYGFYHCFENSAQLRKVKKPSEMED